MMSYVQSIEQSVKDQFARVFPASSRRLFEQDAESNLREAAELRMENIRIDSSLQSLARNARKRLLIGLGVELLPGAAFYKINRDNQFAPTTGSAVLWRHDAQRGRTRCLISNLGAAT
jgi:hypothetical protein